MLKADTACVLLPLSHHRSPWSSPLQIYMKHLTACRSLARLPNPVSIRFDMRGVSVWYTVRPGSGTKGRSTYGKQGFQLEGELLGQEPTGQAACTAAERAEAAALSQAHVEVAARLQSGTGHLACRHCWDCLLPPGLFAEVLGSPAWMRPAARSAQCGMCCSSLLSVLIQYLSPLPCRTPLRGCHQHAAPAWRGAGHPEGAH